MRRVDPHAAVRAGLRFISARDLLAAAVLCLATCVSLPAQESREERARRYLTLERQVTQAFAGGKYQDAINACEAMTNAFPKQVSPCYNLACALARLGRHERALAVLSRAIDLGYDDSEHMRSDDDLASLRDGHAFKALAARARENELKAPFEKGREIKGVRTVEAFPEGGLRYRLRMSETATKEKPDRLIVWLHPSGGSMNSAAESMATAFIARGFALLVPTQKSWVGWSESDARRLLRGTLPDLTKIEALDVRRPILMGFSAGGQLALVLWLDSPGDFGGLVIDAAYPVQSGGLSDGESARVTTLPAGKDFSRTPVFAIIGDRDQKGAAKVVWERAKAEWERAGVPVVLHLVPGRGHEWLFGKEQTALLLDWIERVGQGSLPGAAQSAPRPGGEPAQR